MLVFLGLLVAPAGVWAQSSSSMGMFGNRTTGAGMTAGQSTAFGSGSMMGGQGGVGGMSSRSGFGSSGMGQSGMGSGGTSVGGQARRAGDFVGANPTGQAQNFVGAAQAQGAAGNMAVGGGSYGPGMQMGAAGRAAGAGMQFGAGAAQAPVIRTRLSLGFENPAPDPQKFSSLLGQRLMDLPGIHWGSVVQVEIQGRTAILRGVVATEHDRDLAARVVRLEATIEQVDNKIDVAARSATPATAPRANPSAVAPAGPAFGQPVPVEPGPPGASSGPGSPAAGSHAAPLPPAK
jgi:hypothetical protein